MLSKVSDPVTYLDDLSVSSMVQSHISRTIGITVAFASAWSVQLNPGKSCICLSEAAKKRWSFELQGVPLQSSWDFLGMQLGFSKGSQRTRDRISKATIRIRRIESFPGPYWQRQRLMEVMVPSLCYGLRLEKSHHAAMRDLTSRCWKTVWGKVRFFANENRGCASILSSLANPLNHWWCESARLIWHLGNTQATREMIWLVWDRPVSSSEDGLWCVSCQLPDSLSIIRLQGGVAVLQGGTVPDFSMTLRQWLHQIRWILRCRWAKDSGVCMRDVTRIGWQSLEALKNKGKAGQNPSSTLIAGSFLTASRQWIQWGDVDPRCRCESQDTQLHRLVWCEANERYHREHRWGCRDEGLLLEGGHDWASKGVLLIPSSLCVPGNPRWNSAAYLPGNPRWNSAAYLDILGPDIMERSSHDARGTWNAEIYLEKTKKNGKDVALVGAIEGLGTSRNC